MNTRPSSNTPPATSKTLDPASTLINEVDALLLYHPGSAHPQAPEEEDDLPMLMDFAFDLVEPLVVPAKPAAVIPASPMSGGSKPQRTDQAPSANQPKPPASATRPASPTQAQTIAAKPATLAQPVAQHALQPTAVAKPASMPPLSLRTAPATQPASPAKTQSGNAFQSDALAPSLTPKFVPRPILQTTFRTGAKIEPPPPPQPAPIATPKPVHRPSPQQPPPRQPSATTPLVQRARDALQPQRNAQPATTPAPASSNSRPSTPSPRLQPNSTSRQRDQIHAIANALKTLDVLIAGEVETWVREQLPVLIEAEIDKLSAALRINAINQIHTALLPKISEQIAKQIAKIDPDDEN